MNIVDITATSKKIDVSGMVTAHVDKSVRGKDGTPWEIQEMELSDDSGSIKLSLFNHGVAIKIGDRLTIENGYAGSYLGKPELKVGKYGRLHMQANFVKENPFMKVKGDNEKLLTPGIKEHKHDWEETYVCSTCGNTRD